MDFCYFLFAISNWYIMKGDIEAICFSIVCNLSNIYLHKILLLYFQTEKCIKYPIFMYGLILILLYLI